MIRDCDCTISHRVNGDGCRYCQPQEYIDRMTDWINEARDEIAALAKERNDLEYRLSEAESQLPKWHKSSTPPSHSDWVYMVYVFDGCVRKGVGRYVNGAEPYWISASRDQIKVLQWMDHPLEVTGDIYG